MRNLPIAKLPLVCALGVAALLTLAPTPASADYYQYTYTGNPFTMTYQVYSPDPMDPWAGRQFSLVAIDAVVISDRLLTGPTTEEDIRSMKLTLRYVNDPRSATSLTYPAPPREVCPVCPDFGPFVGGYLRMSNFNELNQPGTWDLQISSVITAPTSRIDSTFYRTAMSSFEQVDSMEAFYQGAYLSQGGLVNSSGVWTLAVLVPEPSTYALMLGGVALLAGLARRRSRGRGDIAEQTTPA
ncbi:PEP-CTERM sorting domain-containing protein [Roseateles chitinivorans]|uniref:PEP-CTERM sorting domain-containing protein n=1 Tax=Roseateles chitinivorans TaxID=2917965 RepID=UPI003D6774BD